MFWLSDGEEIMTLAFFVLIQYRSVTDGQTDVQYSGYRPYYYYYYYYKSTGLKWHYHIKDVAGTLYKIKNINVCEAQIVQLTVSGKTCSGFWSLII